MANNNKKRSAVPKSSNGKRDLNRDVNNEKRSANGASGKSASVSGDQRSYTIRDYRLEKPHFTVRQVRKGDGVHYEVESGDLSRPVPPIRDSKYLSREQCIEIYRWMLLNRRMEMALENLYKQGKVVGGV
jgi:hypothetical protein